MFEWKVEDMALMNERGFVRFKNERLYNCETQLTREEKIAFVDSMQDGKLSYILNLADKFNKDKDTLPKDQYNCVKTVSLKAWIRKNDSRKMVDTFYYYGRINFITERWIHDIAKKGVYDTFEDYVDECFHRQLKECEKAEKKYFREHDEYSILKNQFISKKYQTTFGVCTGYSSNGDIYIYDEEGKNSREITIDELKLLLSKYEQLDQYIEKLSSEVDIKF